MNTAITAELPVTPPADACTCAEPGFCPRYKREMAGRLFEICKGENIDAGTAADYRALWDRQAAQGFDRPLQAAVGCRFAGEAVTLEDGKAATRDCPDCNGRVHLKLFHCTHKAREGEQVTVIDCGTCVYRPVVEDHPRVLLLKNRLSPGDVLVMTAAVHSARKRWPGKFVFAVETSCPAIWEHNPDVVSIEEARARGAEEVETHYPAIDESDGRTIHFMQAYCEFFANALGVEVPLLTNRPMLYLSRAEHSWMSQVQEVTRKRMPFWLVNAGRKGDYTAKFWGTKNYQQVVDLLRGKVLFVQIGSIEHHHPALEGVINLIGRTDTRQLIRLAWHAQGGLGGTTFLQHIMAAWQKPYVCLLGGREPVAWNQYQQQHTLHTMGALACCRDRACWKSRILPLGDNDEKDKSLCEEPVFGGEAVPRCLELTRPEYVAETILRCAWSSAATM